MSLCPDPGVRTQECDGGAEEDHWRQRDHKGRWCTVAASGQSRQTGLWHQKCASQPIYIFTVTHFLLLHLNRANCNLKPTGLSLNSDFVTSLEKVLRLDTMSNVCMSLKSLRFSLKVLCSPKFGFVRS